MKCTNFIFGSIFARVKIHAIVDSTELNYYFIHLNLFVTFMVLSNAQFNLNDLVWNV